MKIVERRFTLTQLVGIYRSAVKELEAEVALRDDMINRAVDRLYTMDSGLTPEEWLRQLMSLEQLCQEDNDRAHEESKIEMEERQDDYGGFGENDMSHDGDPYGS